MNLFIIYFYVFEHQLIILHYASQCPFYYKLNCTGILKGVILEMLRLTICEIIGVLQKLWKNLFLASEFTALEFKWKLRGNNISHILFLPQMHSLKSHPCLFKFTSVNISKGCRKQGTPFTGSFFFQNVRRKQNISHSK